MANPFARDGVHDIRSDIVVTYAPRAYIQTLLKNSNMFTGKNAVYPKFKHRIRRGKIFKGTIFMEII